MVICKIVIQMEFEKEVGKVEGEEIQEGMLYQLKRSKVRVLLLIGRLRNWCRRWEH